MVKCFTFWNGNNGLKMGSERKGFIPKGFESKIIYFTIQPFLYNRARSKIMTSPVRSKITATLTNARLSLKRSKILIKS